MQLCPGTVLLNTSRLQWLASYCLWIFSICCIVTILFCFTFSQSHLLHSHSNIRTSFCCISKKKKAVWNLWTSVSQWLSWRFPLLGTVGCKTESEHSIECIPVLQTPVLGLQGALGLSAASRHPSEQQHVKAFSHCAQEDLISHISHPAQVTSPAQKLSWVGHSGLTPVKKQH